MYKTPRNLRMPPNSLQPMWRYFAYKRLIELLDSGQLFFAHLPNLPDGLEGSLTVKTRDRLFQYFYHQCRDATAAEQSVATYEGHSQAFFVNCWHMNDFESYLMWKAYGERGFAVQTTFERIQISFDRFDGKVNGGIVDYIDFTREEIPIGNVFSAVVKKDLPYRDEREFRLLLWRPGLDPDNDYRGVVPLGVPVPVDLNRLIERIYISPQLKEVPQDLTMLVKAKGLECSIISSTVKENQFI